MKKQSKQKRVKIEEAFEITLPTEMMTALDISCGDSVLFYEDDNGQVCLMKA